MEIEAKVTEFHPASRYEPVPFNLHWAKHTDPKHNQYAGQATIIDVILEHQRLFHSSIQPIKARQNSIEHLDLVMYLPLHDLLYIVDYRIGKVDGRDLTMELELAGNGII